MEEEELQTEGKEKKWADKLLFWGACALGLVVVGIFFVNDLTTRQAVSSAEDMPTAILIQGLTVAQTPTTTQNLTADASSTPAVIMASSATSTDPNFSLAASTTEQAVEHVVLPKEVRGFYWTGYTAGSKRADELMAYALTSHLNTIVIDLKLDDGTLAFIPRNPDLQPYAPTYPAIRDLDGLLAKLKDKGLYRIARIFIMRDGKFGQVHPELALRNADGSLWDDKTGTPWLDPAAPQVADYAVELSREAYARGFDEVQFDYVRFPSDGSISRIKYPVYDATTTKAETMRRLFARLGQPLLAEHIPVSFDLFGLVCCAEDDLGIGQRLVDVYPYTDFISPMTYPSHYAKGFQGFADPADHPYDVVKYSLDQSLIKLQSMDKGLDTKAARLKFRPWIQDFDIGAKYTAPMIQAEIKAARDAGASGWLVWNASNVYTPMDYLKP